MKLETQNLPPTKTCQVLMGNLTQVLMFEQQRPETYYPSKHVKFENYVSVPCTHAPCAPCKIHSCPIHDTSLIFYIHIIIMYFSLRFESAFIVIITIPLP
jgi:hypothetical protein